MVVAAAAVEVGEAGSGRGELRPRAAVARVRRRESIPRRDLIGRVTSPPAWKCASSPPPRLALSVPVDHPSAWFSLGDAVPEGMSTEGAVVAAVVDAVSAAAAAAAAALDG